MNTLFTDNSEGHEWLAQDYLIAMSLPELAELARTLGISAESLVRRALTVRFERYCALSVRKKS